MLDENLKEYPQNIPNYTPKKNIFLFKVDPFSVLSPMYEKGAGFK